METVHTTPPRPLLQNGITTPTIVLPTGAPTIPPLPTGATTQEEAIAVAEIQEAATEVVAVDADVIVDVF